MVGFCAACKRRDEETGQQKGLRYLWLFTLTTLLMLVLTVVGIIYMFWTENVLSLASRANIDLPQNAADDIGEVGTATLRELSKNAFTACGASVTALSNSIPGTFLLTCNNSGFNLLQGTVNAECLHNSQATPQPINASAGSNFHACFAGDMFDIEEWPAPTTPLTPATLLAAMNTPKGTFCACSSQILDNYVLPYLGYEVAAGVCRSLLLARRGRVLPPAVQARLLLLLCQAPRNASHVQLQYGASAIDPNANAPKGKKNNRKPGSVRNDQFLARRDERCNATEWHCCSVKQCSKCAMSVVAGIDAVGSEPCGTGGGADRGSSPLISLSTCNCS